MYIPKYFTIQELVHPKYLEIFPEGLLWSRFNSRYLITLDKLRDRYGAIHINGGGFVDSGVRPVTSSTGGVLSLHRFWAAFDLKFKTFDPVDIMNDIQANQDLFEQIGRMEDAVYTKTWLHIDFGNRLPDGDIYIFKP